MNLITSIMLVKSGGGLTLWAVTDTGARISGSAVIEHKKGFGGREAAGSACWLDLSRFARFLFCVSRTPAAAAAVGRLAVELAHGGAVDEYLQVRCSTQWLTAFGDSQPNSDSVQCRIEFSDEAVSVTPAAGPNNHLHGASPWRVGCAGRRAVAAHQDRHTLCLTYHSGPRTGVRPLCCVPLRPLCCVPLVQLLLLCLSLHLSLHLSLAVSPTLQLSLSALCQTSTLFTPCSPALTTSGRGAVFRLEPAASTTSAAVDTGAAATFALEPEPELDADGGALQQEAGLTLIRCTGIGYVRPAAEV